MARALGSVFGVDIRSDASWILFALLIAWSLASGVFPEIYEGLPQSSYWGMALAMVAGVAASIILHELGHTLVGRSFGVPVRSITLFIFGGVAETEAEPRAPLAELLGGKPASSTTRPSRRRCLGHQWPATEACGTFTRLLDCTKRD